MLIRTITTPIRDYFGRKAIKTMDIGKYKNKNVIITKEVVDNVIQNKTYNIWDNKSQILAYKSRNKKGKFDRWG